MASVTEVRDRFKRILSSFGNIIIGTYKDTERKAATLQRVQLSKGEKADGSQIGEYSAGWAAVRKAKGLQTGFVDLRFSGKLWDGIGFKTITEQFAEINSSEFEKVTKMTNKYGEFLGLSEVNTKDYARNSWFKEYIYKLKNIIYGRN